MARRIVLPVPGPALALPSSGGGRTEAGVMATAALAVRPLPAVLTPGAGVWPVPATTPPEPGVRPLPAAIAPGAGVGARRMADGTALQAWALDQAAAAAGTMRQVPFVKGR